MEELKIVLELIKELKEKRFTGKVTFNFHQGSIVDAHKEEHLNIRIENKK